MKKCQTEFKLEVVKSFLAGEGGAKLLARRWSLPEEKIRSWVSHYRLHGVDGLIRGKKSFRHAPNRSDVNVSNVLQRDFFAKAPNQKWVRVLSFTSLHISEAGRLRLHTGGTDRGRCTRLTGEPWAT